MAAQVVYDCCLLEFYEKITRYPILLQPRQEVSVKKYFPNHERKELILTVTSESFRQEFIFAIGVASIIMLGEGKLYFCISNFNIFPSGFPQIPHNLYFCSNDEIDTNLIIDKTIELLSKKFSRVIKYSTINNFVNIEASGNYPTACYYVRFCTVVYKNKEDMLHTMQHSSHKHCWNFINGYSCTIVAALMRSLQFSFREQGCPMEEIDLYDKKYKPDIIGDLHKVYITLTKVQRSLNINFDIFHVIFDIWLKLLILDAKKRLITDC